MVSTSSSASYYYYYYFFFLIVEALGIKDLLPPYSDPNLKPKDLLTGVCFAVGGVGYDPWTSKLAVINNFMCNLFSL